MLARFFEKYTGLLRNFKFAYVVNNFLNAQKLARNRRLYQKMGLRKSVFAPVGHRDFSKIEKAEIPWLDRDNALEKMTEHVDYQAFTKEIQTQLRHFVEDGYLILNRFFDEKQIAELNAEVEKLKTEGRAGFNYTGR